MRPRPRSPDAWPRSRSPRIRLRFTSPRCRSWCRSACRRPAPCASATRVGRRDVRGGRTCGLDGASHRRGLHGVHRRRIRPHPASAHGRVHAATKAFCRSVSSLLAVAAIFQLFDGIQGVATGILRGLGDTRTPMLWNLVGHWFVGLPSGYVLCFVLGRGVIGLWWGLSIGLIICGVALLSVWSRRIRALGERSSERLKSAFTLSADTSSRRSCRPARERPPRAPRTCRAASCGADRRCRRGSSALLPCPVN